MRNLEGTGGRDFPRSPGEITVGWLNEVLREAGVLSDHALEAVEVQRTALDVGFVGSHARLRLRYARPVPGAPQSLFAKFASEDTAVRSSMRGLYEQEDLFYREVAPLVALPTPRCYVSEFDHESGRSVLLLEDLSGARSGDVLSPCPTSEAEIVLREVAKLHAQWWHSPRLAEWTWLSTYANDPSRAAWITERTGRAWAAFTGKFGSRAPASLLAAGEQVVRRWLEARDILRARATTLTHGDFKLGNLLFDLPDRPLVVIDWQLIMHAPVGRDVAFFLVWSLPVSQRRADEERLIGAYHEALVGAGVRDYPLDACRRDVRLGLLTSLHTLIHAAGMLDMSSERAGAIAAAMIERNAAALEDHDPWRALQ